MTKRREIAKLVENSRANAYNAQATAQSLRIQVGNLAKKVQAQGYQLAQLEAKLAELESRFKDLNPQGD